jgi:thiol-disulfide isomerase/thioredoxin
MALLESIDIPLGVRMPPFTLTDLNGRPRGVGGLMGARGLLVVFTCNHCPYARAVWPRLIRLARKAGRLGVNIVAVNSNINPEYPEDSPSAMRERVLEWGIPFPYLIDYDQGVAKAWRAKCTPDPYLLDAAGRLVYHGRVDDNWKDESKVERRELEEAVEALALGREIPAEQHPAMGCSIKWR